MLKWEEKNGQWYCYKDGNIVTGWIEIDSRWYYLYPTKTVNYGITYPMGAMAIDWVQLNYKWYYLLKENTEYNGNTHYKGEMVASTTMTINNKSYTFNNSGEAQENTTAGDSLVSDNLVKFVAGWESFYANAYEDPYYPGNQSYWTIGYGTCYCSNSSAFPNGLSSTCTESQALEWLKEEINKVAKTIKSSLSNTTLSQQAFDCLCDIGYNAGTGDLIGGNTWNSVISGDPDRITTALMSWNKANGVVSYGLTKRCQSRVNMCLNGVYDSTH